MNGISKNTYMKTQLLLLAVLLTSCIGTSSITKNSGLNESDLAQIPKGAKEILINGDNREQMYNRIVDVLLERGHRIMKEDKERFYITTEGKDIGESTIQRMTIFVNSENQASIKTEWMPGAEATTAASAFSGINVVPQWSAVIYAEDRNGVAFAESVVIAKKVGGYITYK